MKNEKINIGIPLELKRDLKILAAQCDKSFPELIRKALERFVKINKGEKDDDVK